MPLPALLAPLLAQAGGAIGAGSGAAAVGSAASSAGSGAAIGELTSALQGILSSSQGGSGGGLTGYGLGGKTPQLPIPAFGLLGKAAGALIKPFTTLPKQIEDWGDSLLQSKRNLMAFNGAIAGTLLEAERRDIVRKMGEGQRVSGTTEYLSEGLSDFKDAIQPIKDTLVNFFNLAAGNILRIATIGTKILRHTNSMLIVAEFIQRNWPFKGKQENVPFVRFINDVKAGKLDQFNDDRGLMGAGVERDIQ